MDDIPLNDTVTLERDGPLWTLTIRRPQVRNAVDGITSRALASAFKAFEADPDAAVAVLAGSGGHFCAGADLKAVAQGLDHPNALPLNSHPGGDGPMGPTRLVLTKPVIAAIEGHAVAGGLELALWCDLRVIDDTAVFGVFNRRWGVPLIDGGTVRLPRLIGESRAMDLILTGRPVEADEAMAIGLANRRVPTGQALRAAQELARHIAGFPQRGLRCDRGSVLRHAGSSLSQALAQEFALGLQALHSGETVQGAGRFAAGQGRHGEGS